MQEFPAEKGHQWLQGSRVAQGGRTKAREPSSQKKGSPLLLDLPQRLQGSVISFGIIEILAL